VELYGVGTGKSGTTSLAAMFRPRFRAAHEAELAALLPLAAAATDGTHDPEEARATLRSRRARLQLEVDVAGALNPLVGDLVTTFPDARFVLTIRNCFAWLESRIDQRARIVEEPIAPAEALRAAELRVYGGPYSDGDVLLEQLGLPPMRGLLRRWAEANSRVFGAVPAERLLVVRTEDLDASHARIAEFAGCAASDLVPAKANQRTVRTGALDALDQGALREAAEQHCAELMERFWGRRWLAPHRS
jgi:hypothetical protein